MSDLSEFNNNNYMPGYYGDMNSIARHNVAAALSMRGGTAPQGFTFSSPTHGSTMATPRTNIQTSNQFGYMSAPGVGTTWQHSVPTTMPWSTMASTMTQPNPSFFDESVPTFTAFHAQMEPQPSCSSPMKRPKRKALEYSDDAPTSKVYLCADQFANLQISPEKKADSERHVRTISYNSNSGLGKNGKQDLTDWERFKELENSIEIDHGEDITKRENVLDKQKGILCIDEKIIQGASSTTSPILPKAVLDDISKSSLQVVLWRSPGQIMRDVVKEDNTSLPLPASASSLLSSSQPSSSSSSSLSSSTSSLSSQNSTPGRSQPSRDSMMEEMPLVNNARVSHAYASSAMRSSSNSCLLSPSSNNLGWLHTSPSHFHLMSSDQGEMPFIPFANSGPFSRSSLDLLDDDMQL